MKRHITLSLGIAALGILAGFSSTARAGLDATNHSQLAHTRNRYTLLENLKLGNITELGASIYLNETLRLNDQFSLNAGLRFDQFYYAYHNINRIITQIRYIKL